MEKSTLSGSKTYYETISNQGSMFRHINRLIINEIESAEYTHIYMVDRFFNKTILFNSKYFNGKKILF